MYEIAFQMCLKLECVRGVKRVENEAAIAIVGLCVSLKKCLVVNAYTKLCQKSALVLHES